MRKVGKSSTSLTEASKQVKHRSRAIILVSFRALTNYHGSSESSPKQAVIWWQ